MRIGIDVGGSAIKAGLFDSAGQLVRSATAPTPPGLDPLTSSLVEIVRELSAPDPTAPLGVAVPGIVDEQAGIGVWSANLGWRDEPLAERFSHALNRPVRLGQDVRCGALAEWTAAGGEDLLFLAIGTGISSALILGGKLIVTGGWAGEIGQVKVATSQGLKEIEQLASAAGLTRLYTQRTGRPVTGAKEVFAAPDSQPIIAEAMELLAQVLAPAVATVGPVPLTIGGAVSQAGVALLSPLRTALAARLPAGALPEISAAILGPAAQMRGAAILAARPT